MKIAKPCAAIMVFYFQKNPALLVIRNKGTKNGHPKSCVFPNLMKRERERERKKYISCFINYN